ncbi:hypothetical protein [Ottowia sp.]|uniref:hypothetical protein n=1 Tax=Ottowia sp. TaxID=1898956 RepID=UPI0025E13042|nr:hypothetical protein [Ottowia sp.]
MARPPERPGFPARIDLGSRPAPAKRPAPSAAVSVRSTDSGVSGSWPCAVARQSVPALASSAPPAPPIPYLVPQ